MNLVLLQLDIPWWVDTHGWPLSKEKGREEWGRRGVREELEREEGVEDGIGYKVDFTIN